MNPVLSYMIASFLLTACLNYSPGEREGSRVPANAIKLSQKPGSSFNDTLALEGPVAVFFSPDSLQLEKIRKVTDPQVFKGSMHEYAYQIRNAKIVLKQYWPRVRMVETKNKRYLAFYKKEATNVIDLNHQDPCGMFLFDGKKAPRLIDMMNIDTQVPDYFQKRP